MSKYPVGQPRLFSSNKNTVKFSEQECFVVRATNVAAGWSNPVFMQTTECWTCYVTKATVFTSYDAALSMIAELRDRPPRTVTGREILRENTVLEAVPYLGQVHRNRDISLKKR